MALLPVDSDEETKYHHHRKKTSPYRKRTLLFLFLRFLLPTAATVTTDVWFESAILLSSFGYELVLAITNVSGAFLDGFFSDWEISLIPCGAKTEVLHIIADDIRTYYLSTYTSWAGMVGVAASLAHARSSVLIGILYIILSILMAFVAHGLGSDFAHYISSTITDPNTMSKSHIHRAQKLLQRGILSLSGYIILTYIYLGEENIEESDDKGKEFWIIATPRNQLWISSIFAILGAYIGHILVGIISDKLRHPGVPMETLICNWFFGLLSLTLNIMKLLDISWGDSLLLRGFAINFCGAASMFAKHTSDNRRLYTAKKGKGAQRAAITNMTANIIFATIVFWVAFEIEEWEQPHETRRGVVVKILKVLERRRAKQNLSATDMPMFA